MGANAKKECINLVREKISEHAASLAAWRKYKAELDKEIKEAKEAIIISLCCINKLQKIEDTLQGLEGEGAEELSKKIINRFNEMVKLLRRG